MNERRFFIIFIQSAFHALFTSYLILYSLSVCVCVRSVATCISFIAPSIVVHISDPYNKLFNGMLLYGDMLKATMLSPVCIYLHANVSLTHSRRLRDSLLTHMFGSAVRRSSWVYHSHSGAPKICIMLNNWAYTIHARAISFQWRSGSQILTFERWKRTVRSCARELSIIRDIVVLWVKMHFEH